MLLNKTNGMESNLQLDQINSQISVYCNRIDLLKRAEDEEKKGKNSFNKKNEHYYKTIAEFTNERVQYEVELEKLKSQKDAIQKGTEQYVVTAQMMILFI
ncbi:hypothetical protein [Clostridium paraputrificum]|uniref:hypothetical protein n=1 Tax=Clostridium paraputrificum TaxID=29363 RepID=UPI001FAD066C|nr:hypothetical protein [Clostridium paraputrificum]MDB2125604.1 hypothetical protein [Clostridium paraputrificum]